VIPKPRSGEPEPVPGRHRDQITRRLRGSRRICWLSAALSAVVVVGFHRPSAVGRLDVATVFFVFASTWLVVMLGLAGRGRSFGHLPVAEGRVVALLPTYNEDPRTLHACIASLLAGTRVPDVIHVVDDGSVVPAPEFVHPRVVWHRTVNQGKRAAQVHGLDREPAADFVLTVDSDSIVDVRALEEMLRPMSDPQVQAATGTCLVRNRTQNLLTRLTDLEFVGGNFVMRRARSALGAVAPTSGPLAIYRAEIVRDNRDDYLASGTYGDDRRLTHYSLLRGKVVLCENAIVEMEMPTTLPTIFRQRVRWSKGYVKYLPWELGHLSGPALFLRMLNTALIGCMPFVLVAAFVIAPVTQHKFYWLAWAYWCTLLYAQTLPYAVGRPMMTATARWSTWLIATPFLIALQFVVLRPALYVAVLQVRNDDWVTRDAPADTPSTWQSEIFFPAPLDGDADETAASIFAQLGEATGPATPPGPQSPAEILLSQLGNA
jgi:glycosyltransferase involved in cell wall biosynthesis